MNFRVRRQREPQVVIVSLVDVVLQLVIFLVLTSTFKAGEYSLSVEVPEASTASRNDSVGITVEIDRSGKLSVKGREILKEELGAMLRSEGRGDSGKSLLIRADRQAAHGDVIDVMDLARRSEVRSLVIAAALPAPRGGP